MGTGTRALAAFAAQIDHDALPETVVGYTKQLLLDAIGVTCAGLKENETVAAHKAAQEWGLGSEATVVGRQFRLPAHSAAFANAFAGRIHTFDDTYEPGTVHAGTVVISAALATAQKMHTSPRDFIAAIIGGLEISCRVAGAVNPQHYAIGFHNTGTCNAFGAAAASARARRLTADATEQALGLAMATAAGTRQHQLTGSLADTAFHGARAAQTGVTAADMVANGAIGPTAILDGKFGFCRMFCPEPGLEALGDRLGTHFEFMRITIKPFPSCRFTHGPIDAALSLRRAHAIDPQNIERVEIGGFARSIEVSNRPEPSCRTDAVMSHQFTVASALVRGNLPLSAFGEDAIGNSVLYDLVKRVDVHVDDEMEALYPHHQAHRVVITMKDGQKFSAQRDDPPGGTLSPPPRSLVHDKFLSLVEPVFGEGGANRIAEAVDNVTELSSLDELTKLLSVGPNEQTKTARGKL